MRHTHGFSLSALFILLLVNTSAWALPSVNSETAVEDRIRVSLYVNEKTINGDTESYCRVYVSTNVAGYFQAGEELRVKVWANDVQILSINESLTSADETSGSIYKNYNCQGSFGTASTHDIKTNVYLEDDRWLGFAEEIDISVTSEGVDDDTAEENDTASNATPLTTESVEYILRDDDYLELNIEPPAATELIIYAYFNEGPIRVSLLDEVSLAVEESFEISNDFVRELDLGNLTESRYFVKLEPLYGSDYNFYQIQYTATSTGDCTPGDTEMRPCGNCGSQTRECNSEGQWQLFETCESEGICEAGDTQTIACEEEGSSKKSCAI